MTLRHIHWTLAVACMIAAMGCAGGKNMASSAPEWTFNSPVLPAHYVGIGSASKLIHPLDADGADRRLCGIARARGAPKRREALGVGHVHDASDE